MHYRSSSWTITIEQLGHFRVVFITGSYVKGIPARAQPGVTRSNCPRRTSPIRQIPKGLDGAENKSESTIRKPYFFSLFGPNINRIVFGMQS